MLGVASLAMALGACVRGDVHRARASTTSDPRTATYVGYEYEAVTPHHSLPNGVLNAGGALVDSPSSKPMFAIDLMSRDGVDMLWFTHNIGGTNLHLRWHVDDVLDVPALEKGQILVWDASCAMNGVADPEIVAVVVHTDTEEYTQVVRAWRADRRARAFRPIDTAGVSCANDGYGAED